jgi:WD40 repeat protein
MAAPAPFQSARSVQSAHSAQTAKKLRLFISYSRKDAALADRLVLALEANDFEVTIDRRDLPYGQEWQKELADFIRASDTVVWLVSPDSVASQWCNWELGELTRLAKRLMPVRVRATDPAALPASLGKVHILPVEGSFDLGADLAALLAALETDRAWIKQGTAWVERAHQWKGQPAAEGPAPQPDRSALLSGAQLRRAEAWRLQQPAKAPQPGADVLGLILSSRTAATARQWWMALGAVLLVSSLALFLWQRQVALQRQDGVHINQSRQLASLAEQSRLGGDAVRALLLSLEALPDAPEGVQRPHVPEAERTLYASLLEQRETQLLADPQPYTVSVQPQAPAQAVPAITQNNVLRLVDLPAQRIVGKHPGTDALITKAYWRADGLRLVAVSNGIDSSQAFLWDLKLQRQVAALEGHSQTITAVAFSSDGNWLATASEDGQVRVFDAHTGTGERQFGDPLALALHSLAFSPDGGDIAVGTRDGAIQLWAWRSAQLRRTLAGRHKGQVSAVHFIEQGRRLLSVAWDREVMMQGLRGPSRPVRMEGHRDIALDAALSPDGRQLLTGSQDKTARVWDLVQAQALLPVLQGHEASVETVAFAPNGNRALTASKDGAVRLWRATRRDGFQLDLLLQGHHRIEGAQFTADGATVLSYGNGSLRGWQAQPQPERGVVGAHGGWVVGAAYSPSGQQVLSYARDHSAALWPAAGGAASAPLRGHRNPVVAAGFSADGARVVTVSLDGSARRWSAQDGSPLPGTITGLHNGLGLNLLAPGAKRLLTTDGQAQAVLWDLEKGQSLIKLPAPAASADAQLRRTVAWADFSADGELMVTVPGLARPSSSPNNFELFNGGHASLWQARTGALVKTIGGEGWDIERSAFSPDGRRLALALRGGAVRVMALPEGNELVAIAADLGRSGDTRWRGLAFSADGQRLVTSSRSTAQVWDAHSGQEVARIAAAPGGTVGRAIFTRDGRRLVSYERNTARVWDLPSGAEVAQLAGHTQGITGLSLSPDGARVLTSSVDGSVRVWPLFSSTEGIVQHAKKVSPRCLGADERGELSLPETTPCWCSRLHKWQPPVAQAASGSAAANVAPDRVCGK